MAIQNFKFPNFNFKEWFRRFSFFNQFYYLDPDDFSNEFHSWFGLGLSKTNTNFIDYLDELAEYFITQNHEQDLDYGDTDRATDFLNYQCYFNRVMTELHFTNSVSGLLSNFNMKSINANTNLKLVLKNLKIAYEE